MTPNDKPPFGDTDLGVLIGFAIIVLSTFLGMGILFGAYGYWRL
jgi:hypothetical protein